MKNTLNDDIIYSQKVINATLGIIKNKDSFHNKSFIYKFSNEQMNNYMKYLTKKEKSLQIISSGDQILNSVLVGIYNIDGYDISNLPKYFLALKIAAIKTIPKEDYIKFFLEDTTTNGEEYDDIYAEIKKELSTNDKTYWDHLLQFYDWQDIYNSPLFSNEFFTTKSVITKNHYLQGENYNKLKENLNHLNLSIYTDDIHNLVYKLPYEYDLVNLSNICSYISMKNYMEILNNLKLSNNGLAITYLYNIKESIIKLQQKLKVTGIISFDQFNDKQHGVMIYKK